MRRKYDINISLTKGEVHRMIKETIAAYSDYDDWGLDYKLGYLQGWVDALEGLNAKTKDRYAQCVVVKDFSA